MFDETASGEAGICGRDERSDPAKVLVWRLRWRMRLTGRGDGEALSAGGAING
jgi:hypothetical protein